MRLLWEMLEWLVLLRIEPRVEDDNGYDFHSTPSLDSSSFTSNLMMKFWWMFLGQQIIDSSTPYKIPSILRSSYPNIAPQKTHQNQATFLHPDNQQKENQHFKQFAWSSSCSWIQNFGRITCLFPEYKKNYYKICFLFHSSIIFYAIEAEKRVDLVLLLLF